MGRGHNPEAYRGSLRPGMLLGAAHQPIVPICRSATALTRFAASVVAGVAMSFGALEAQPQISSVTDPNRDAERVGSEVIAVVPFVNISGDPADDWIGSGIAATVVADATRIGSVVLLPRSQTVASGRPGARNSLATAGEALRRARDLAADWLVTGGYQRVADQVRITARLVDPATGRVITSATVDGVLDELFALQDRIVTQLNLAEAAAAAPDVPSRAASEPVSVTGGITIGHPATSASGSERSPGVLVGRPTVLVPIATDVPRIDGRLDDALWGSAVRITEFVQQRPLKRFSNRPCTTWGGRGTSARTDAGGPMRASSMDLRERALLDSDAGMKAADVAAKYRVSGSWVRLLKQRRRDTGEVAPRVERQGRRGMLEPHLHTLAALMAAHPDRTLAELKDALATPASVPTVWRAVRALGLTVTKNGPPVRTRSA